MESREGNIILIISLLTAVLCDGAEIAARGDDVRILVPRATTNLTGDSALSTEEEEEEESHGNAFLSNGVLWELSTEETSSSLSEIVPPEINCTEEGFFPVTGSCYEFYYCEDLANKGLEDWYILWFTCPDGNVFDVDSLKCSHRSLVMGHPECQVAEGRQVDINNNALTSDDEDLEVNNEGLVPGVEEEMEVNLNMHGGTGVNSEISGEISLSYDSSEQDGIFGDRIRLPEKLHHQPNRKKRSTDIMKVDIVAQSARETCADARNIDDYVKHVKSKSSLSLPSQSDREITNIIQEYNKILTAAQQNTNSWKDENGILAAISGTFLLTQRFEPDFRQKIQGMRNRVATILEKDKLDIDSIEIELNEVKENIRGMEEILKMPDNVKVDEYIIQSLKEMLEDKKRDHRRLVTAYKRAQKETEFQELTEILSNLKANAVEIQDKAEDTRGKMEHFQGNVMKDSSNFKRNRAKAENGMQNIQKKRDDNNREISRINALKTRKRNSIWRERNRIAELNNQLEESKRELQQQKDRLQREVKAADKKKLIGGLLLIIPVYGWIAGGVLLGQGIQEKKNAIRLKENVVREYIDTIQIHNRQVTYMNNEINSADRSISRLESTTRHLQRELPQLTNLDNNLQNLQNNVDSTLPFLTKAITSLEKMKEVFQEAEWELENVIGEAGKAHTHAEKRVVSYFMYHIEDKIKLHWENARDKIISVGECVSTK